MTSALSYTNSFLMPTVLRSALEVANDTDFKELRKIRKTPTSVNDRISLLLLRPLNAFLFEMQETIFRMDVEEAKAILDMFLSPEKITVIREKTSNAFLHPDASSVEVEIFKLIKSLISIFDDLQVAANDAPINEASEGYQRFLDKMVEEAVATPPTHGKKALYDLFKD